MDKYNTLSSLSKVLRKRSELCNSIIFSTSDFISDAAAAFVVKMFSSSATRLAFFYHITPGPFTRTEKFSRFLKNMFSCVIDFRRINNFNNKNSQ